MCAKFTTIYRRCIIGRRHNRFPLHYIKIKMFESSFDYTFNNIGRIGNDATDNSQKNLQNTTFANYMLSNYSSNNQSYMQFALNQPTVNYEGINGGSSVGSSNIDMDSQLLYKSIQEGSPNKIQLSERPFLTVPYLGRGSCDPTIESQLLQGDSVSSRKSVSTISETTYMDYDNYPMMDSLKNTITNPKYMIEESAGWVRGGTPARAY
jgi:hypothetical protein